MLLDVIEAIYKTSKNYTFSAEDKLLVSCARENAVPERIREILRSDLDWEYIIKSANTDNIAPILYYNLKNYGDGLVHKESLKKLRNLYAQSIRISQLAMNELEIVLNSFFDANIKVILLKGISLSNIVYSDSSFRPIGDIDLMIKKDDLHIAEERLSLFGYHLLGYRNYPPDFIRFASSEICYIKEEGISLDLHWNISVTSYIAQSSYIPIDSFWKTSLCANIQKFDVRVLSPEYQLMYLCLHAQKHLECKRDFKFIWLVDISEVISRYNETFDWDLFLEKISEFRIRSSVLHVLYLVKEIFDIQVLDHLNPEKLSYFRKLLIHIILDAHTPAVARRLLREFLIYDGVIPKIRCILTKVYLRILTNLRFSKSVSLIHFC